MSDSCTAFGRNYWKNLDDLLENDARKFSTSNSPAIPKYALSFLSKCCCRS